MASEIVAFLVVVVLVGGMLALILVSHRTEKRRRAEYVALAERRGWEHVFERSRGNRPAELHFLDPAGGIELVVTRKLTRKSGSGSTTKGGSTVASLREPRLQGGLAVYTPPLDPKLAQAASSMLGVFDNSVARFFIGRLLGEDIGDHLGQLVEQPVPQGLPLSILATIDPAPFIEAAPIARALKASGDEKAMVMVSTQGTRLRLGRPLNEAADIERLFDTAQALAAGLGGAPPTPQRLSN